MWFGFPPFEAGKEIHHAFVAFEHHHRVIPAPIDPTPAHVRPNVDPSPHGFSRSPVSARHRDVPGHTTQSFCRVSIRLRCPMWIMIFVSVLLVGLRNDSSRRYLNPPLIKHQSMLSSRPILDRCESEPSR